MALPLRKARAGPRGVAHPPTPLGVRFWASAARFLDRAFRPGGGVGTVVILAFTVAQILKFSDKTNGDWSHNPLLGVYQGLAIASAVVGSLSLAVYRQLRTRERRANALEDGCRELVRLLTKRGSIDIDNIGAWVWRKRGWGPAAELVPVAHFYFYDRLASNITWTIGKGVIGQCWKHREEEFYDLRSLRAYDRADFDALSEKARCGLAHSEYHLTRQFDAVWAYPLLSDSPTRFCGCVSVDIQGDEDPEDLFRALHMHSGLKGDVQHVVEGMRGILCTRKPDH